MGRGPADIHTSKVKAKGTLTTSYMKSVAVPCAKYLDRHVHSYLRKD